MSMPCNAAVQGTRGLTCALVSRGLGSCREGLDQYGRCNAWCENRPSPVEEGGAPASASFSFAAARFRCKATRVSLCDEPPAQAAGDASCAGNTKGA